MKKIIILFILFGLFSCVDEYDNTTTQTTNGGTNVKVETTITGLVVDESGVALVNVPVIVGEHNTFTNEYGAFLFKDIAVDIEGAQVKSIVNGYFFGSSYVYPRSGRTHSTRITLMEKGDPIVINTATVNEVTIENPNGSDGEVRFSANAFVDENGNTYNGDIHLSVRYLDPTLLETSQTMPGALIARNETNGEGVLTSFGMLAVEMETSSGDEVFLANEKPADLVFPIADGILADAPSIIPLWFYDEEQGIWLEEGQASKIEDTYKAQVTHFTFWNCDLFSSATFLEGRVINLQDEGLRNLKVELTQQGNGSTAQDFTDDQGYFRGAVPQDIIFDMNIYSHCDLIYSDEIGPFFEADVMLNDIVIDMPDTTQQINMTLSGRLLDCDGNPLGLARLDILKQGEYFDFGNTDDLGFFSVDLKENCAMNELSFFGYDRNKFMTTDTISFGFQEALDVGDVYTCNDSYPEVARINLEFWYIGTSDQIDFDYNNFEITGTRNGPEVLHLKLDNYNGLGEYTTGTTGSFSNISTPWCTGDSITFDSLHINVITDTGKYIYGEFTPMDWTVHNDIPDQCLGLGEVPFIIGYFICEY